MTLENSYYGKGFIHTLVVNVGWLWSVTLLSPFAFRMTYRSTPHSYILLRDISRNYPRGKLLELNKDGSYERHSHRDKAIFIVILMMVMLLRLVKWSVIF